MLARRGATATLTSSAASLGSRPARETRREEPAAGSRRLVRGRAAPDPRRSLRLRRRLLRLRRRRWPCGPVTPAWWRRSDPPTPPDSARGDRAILPATPCAAVAVLLAMARRNASFVLAWPRRLASVPRDRRRVPRGPPVGPRLSRRSHEDVVTAGRGGCAGCRHPCAAPPQASVR